MRHFLLRMCQERSMKLQMTEVDILRSGKHDLSRRKCQVSYWRRARQGEHDTVIARPAEPSPARGGQTAKDLAQSGSPTAPAGSPGCQDP